MAAYLAKTLKKAGRVVAIDKVREHTIQVASAASGSTCSVQAQRDDTKRAATTGFESCYFSVAHRLDGCLHFLFHVVAVCLLGALPSELGA